MWLQPRRCIPCALLSAPGRKTPNDRLAALIPLTQHGLFGLEKTKEVRGVCGACGARAYPGTISPGWPTPLRMQSTSLDPNNGRRMEHDVLVGLLSHRLCWRALAPPRSSPIAHLDLRRHTRVESPPLCRSRRRADRVPSGYDGNATIRSLISRLTQTIGS